MDLVSLRLCCDASVAQHLAPEDNSFALRDAFGFMVLDGKLALGISCRFNSEALLVVQALATQLVQSLAKSASSQRLTRILGERPIAHILGLSRCP
jgi:hypothetical protein